MLVCCQTNRCGEGVFISCFRWLTRSSLSKLWALSCKLLSANDRLHPGVVYICSGTFANLSVKVVSHDMCKQGRRTHVLVCLHLNNPRRCCIWENVFWEAGCIAIYSPDNLYLDWSTPTLYRYHTLESSELLLVIMEFSHVVTRLVIA